MYVLIYSNDGSLDEHLDVEVYINLSDAEHRMREHVIEVLGDDDDDLDEDGFRKDCFYRYGHTDARKLHESVIYAGDEANEWHIFETDLKPGLVWKSTDRRN